MIELQTYTCQTCELNTVSIPCGSEEVWRIKDMGWTAFYEGDPPALAVFCPDCEKREIRELVAWLKEWACGRPGSYCRTLDRLERQMRKRND